MLIRGPVFSLSNISTNKCKVKNIRTMMTIILSIMLTKAKETITCTGVKCLLAQHRLVCYINKLKRFETLFCDCFN